MGEEKEKKLGVDGNLYRYHCPKCDTKHIISNYPENIEKLYVPGLEGEYCFDCREKIKAEKANKDLNITK